MAIRPVWLEDLGHGASTAEQLTGVRDERRTDGMQSRYVSCHHSPAWAWVEYGSSGSNQIGQHFV